jgi:hypothetical protein
MAQELKINISANEVLTSRAKVEVSSSEPLDPRSAQAAITLDTVRVLVRLSTDRRTATLYGEDGGPLPPGRHVLLVEELLTADGERLPDSVGVPFLVTDTTAPIPQDMRLDGMVRLAVDELGTRRLVADQRPDAPFIEIFKAVHRETRETTELAFVHIGNRIDATEMLGAVARNRAERFGKLQPDLYELIERSPEDTITVAIWFAMPSP